MSRIHPFSAGLTLGLHMGAVLAAWIAVVAFAGTPWPSQVVLPEAIVRAIFAPQGVDLGVTAFLLAMTVLAGCGLGWLAAAIWNGVAALRIRPLLVPPAGR